MNSLNSLRNFSTHINACTLITPKTRTYLSKFSPLISFHRSFQNSIKKYNNNNKDDDINNLFIKDFNNDNKRIDLFDKILSNDTEKNVDDSLNNNNNNNELFSILKESLSKSKSISISKSISSENESILATTTTTSPSETSPDISNASNLDSISLFKTPPETSTSTSESTTTTPSTETDTPTIITIDKNDPRFMKEDPVILHLTNMMMRDGKKATARRVLANAMIEIRKQTHNDPYLITKAAIEKISPLVSYMTHKKGSKVTIIPRSLSERQRHFKGIKWILEASDKRSGKVFSIRLANEILAVINDTSDALKRREQLHKLAVANRANLPVKW